MAKFSDIIKSIIDKETISKNKWLIMMIIIAFGGGGGTIYQSMEVLAKEKEKIKAIHEVATGFQMAITSAKPKKPTIKHITKTVTIEKSCNKCEALLSDHVNKLH